jgi:hypothetical protein
MGGTSFNLVAGAPVLCIHLLQNAANTTSSLVLVDSVSSDVRCLKGTGEAG